MDSKKELDYVIKDNKIIGVTINEIGKYNILKLAYTDMQKLEKKLDKKGITNDANQVNKQLQKLHTSKADRILDRFFDRILGRTNTVKITNKTAEQTSDKTNSNRTSLSQSNSEEPVNEKPNLEEQVNINRQRAGSLPNSFRLRENASNKAPDQEEPIINKDDDKEYHEQIKELLPPRKQS